MPAFTDPKSRFDWLVRALEMDERARAWWPTLHALMQIDLDATGAMPAITELVAFEEELKRPVLRVAKAIAAHRLERADARRATALVGVGLVQLAALGFGFRLLARGPEQRKAIGNEIAVTLAIGHVARAIDERRRDVDGGRAEAGLFARAALTRLPRLLVAIADFRMLADLGALPGLDPEAGRELAYFGTPLAGLAEAVVRAWTRREGTLESADDDPAVGAMIRVAVRVVAALVRADGTVDDPAVAAAMASEPACAVGIVRPAVLEARASFANAIEHLQLPDPLVGERWPIAPPPLQTTFDWPPAPAAEVLVNGAPENAVWCAACTVREVARADATTSNAEAMEKTLFALQKGMGYARALVFLRDANGDMRAREAVGHGTKPLIGKLAVPMQGHRSPLHDALRAGELFTVPWTAKSFDTPVWVDQALPGTGSIVVVPILAVGGTCVGFLYADRATGDPLLTSAERTALRKLADALAKAFVNTAKAKKGEAARVPAAS